VRRAANPHASSHLSRRSVASAALSIRLMEAQRCQVPAHTLRCDRRSGVGWEGWGPELVVNGKIAPEAEIGRWTTIPEPFDKDLHETRPARPEIEDPRDLCPASACD